MCASKINTKPSGVDGFKSFFRDFFTFSVKLTGNNLLLKNQKLEKYKNQLEQLIQDRTDEILQLNRELIVTNEELYTANDSLIIQRDYLEKAFTQLKEAQNRLVQSEKMASLGVLVAGIAHEINNPINFINTGILGLKENLDDLFELFNQYREITPENINEKLPQLKAIEKSIEYDELVKLVQDLLNNIKTGIDRTVNIVKGLRTFARSDEKELSFFNIHTSIDVTLLMLHSKYKNRITIEKQYGDIPEIEGFSGQINQVFMNILSNAIDSISQSGIITINTSFVKNQDKIKIVITDNGHGIKDEIVSKIFDPFFSTKPTGEGVGLGLSITYSIIKDHNGDIEVKGNPGKGAEFIITLPIKQ